MRVLLVRIILPLAFVAAAVPVSSAIANTAAPSNLKVGIVQKLGHYVPMNLVFRDSEGQDVTLKQVANGKPLIIDMGYYECPNLCDVVMSNLEGLLDELSEVPGKSFNVATISFNPSDGPTDARNKKAQFYGSMKRHIPATAWRFLTGDSVNIYSLTNALGFYFIRDKYGKFVHPTALIIVEINGKIVRYIPGTKFALSNVETALAEAKTDVPEDIISTGPWMSFSTPWICFSRKPSGLHIADRALQYGGVGTMVLVAGFLFFVRKKKNPKNT